MILPDHHAILMEGGAEDSLALFKKHLKSKRINTEQNPDIVTLQIQSFGIDDSRSLIDLAIRAPVSEEKKTIILLLGDITREAQNALLKLFEDPNPQVEFLVSVENVDALLPTLRSRLHVLGRGEGGKEGRVEGGMEARKFIKLPIGERMSFIEKMVKDQKDSGSKSEIRSFLHSLRAEIIGEGRESSLNLGALEAVDRALLYIDDKGSAVKMLLESVALAL